MIDTHCHLDFDIFDHDRDRILSACLEKNIKSIIIPAVYRGNWQKVLGICRMNQMLYPALGMHPLFMEKHVKEDIHHLNELVKSEDIVAIGEIGLDYYDKNIDKSLQQIFFESQLEIAEKENLPVILHVRKAHDECIKTLRQYKIQGGIAHAFNGSIQQAEHYIELGFKLGFGGVLTYENANKIKNLAATVPLSSIVLETDSPDMVVSSHKGKRNSPEYLDEIAFALSKLRGIKISELDSISTQNAQDIFKLSEH